MANGAAALGLNTSGSFNTATGVSALADNTTGSSNVANGAAALESNTLGADNTADGAGAMISNTTGVNNTATGNIALGGNTTGGSNTGIGFSALVNNTTGTGNTAIGVSAGPDSAHPNLSNSTAIGANAVVTASNAMVLGATGTNVGIGTSAPAFALDVHGNGNFTGPITFAAGQTFPGTGTITGITPGTALTGGGSSGSVTLNVDTTKVVTGVTAGTGLTGGGTGGVQTLNIDTTKVPQLAAANTFTGNQTVNGTLSASGVVSGSSFSLSGTPFAFGSYNNGNAFLGFAGNATTTGAINTGVGEFALYANTTGIQNTATGFQTLASNTGGSWNAANGANTMLLNTTGSENTADGALALGNNSTGTYNTALGYGAGPDSAHPNLSNATAIGANAQVTASNSLVLGSGANVGIGTTAPASTLDVEATAPALVGPIFLLKNNAPIQSGTFGNSVDLHFALDGGSSVGNPNAYVRVAEDGNSQYGAWMSFATMADGGSGSGPLERLRITASGLVGINTTAPDSTLSVNGSADKPGGGSWGTFSDRRLKDLDGDFDSGLNAILKLHPIRYRYKDGNGMGIQDRDQHIGFVAQEVQKVIPEAVTENNKGFLLVNNDPILWTMLNAIKEQQRQIQEQRRLIQAQQRQIAHLADKVGVLETAQRTTKRANARTTDRTGARENARVETSNKFLAAK